MKRKALVTTILAVILLTMCATMFCACEGEKPRDVILELVNPTTGEIIKNGDTIVLPEKRTRMKMLVKDKETGEYLTDDDLPGNTIKGSCHTTLWGGLLDERQSPPLTNDYWPLLEDIKSHYDYFEVTLKFDYVTNEIAQDPKFKRKYYYKYEYVTFYINMD